MPFLLILLFSLSIFAGTRPSDRVFFKADYCICEDGKATSFGNCSAFCQDKVTNGLEILFARFDFQKTHLLKNTRDWCEKVLPFNTRRPHCVMDFENDRGEKFVLP